MENSSSAATVVVRTLKNLIFVSVAPGKISSSRLESTMACTNPILQKSVIQNFLPGAAHDWCFENRSVHWGCGCIGCSVRGTTGDLVKDRASRRCKAALPDGGPWTGGN